jgi:hypothetical protein
LVNGEELPKLLRGAVLFCATIFNKTAAPGSIVLAVL